MTERDPCKSVRNNARGLCKDGFPQGAACLGIGGHTRWTQWCMSEVLCLRIWPETGTPPQSLLDSIAAEDRASAAQDGTTP